MPNNLEKNSTSALHGDLCKADMVLSSAEAKAEDRAAEVSRSLPLWDCASTQHIPEVADYQNYHPEIPAFPHLSSEKTKKEGFFF